MRNHYQINPVNLFLILITVTIFFSLNFISCSSSAEFIDKPIGNNIDIIMKDQTVHSELEFLFVYEDTLYTLYAESKVFPIPLRQIEQITINGYSDKSWIFGILGLQVVPPLTMGAVANSGNAWGLAGIMLIPAVIEAAMFESSTPKAPLFKSPIEEKVPALIKYARYPIELSRENINTIEEFYGITMVRNIKKQ